VARDGIAVAESLRTYPHKDKIILLGWSWGSVLGVHMVQARPDLFATYVGLGQIVNMQAGETIVYTQTALGTQRKWASILAGDKTPIVKIAEITLLAPRTSLRDAWSSLSGIVASQNHFLGPTMEGEMMKVDLAASDRDFAIPIFVFQGANDDFTPVQLAQEYVDGITSPQKDVVLIADAGHDAIITKSGEFLELLVQRVRPLAIPTGTDHSIGAVTSVEGTGSATNTFLGRAVVH
jgi:pimeloyl-ACP methyl ester carboxylesterase